MFNCLELPKNECSICLENININKKVTTDCNHTFCNKCFFKWIRINSNCPTCRKEFVSPPKAVEIEEQQHILNELRFRQGQIREFIRMGIIEYEKKDKQINVLEEKKTLLRETIIAQNEKLENLCKGWIKKKKEIEIEHKLLKIDTEALRTTLTDEKKRLRKSYKKEWSKLHNKQPWWKNIVHR